MSPSGVEASEVEALRFGFRISPGVRGIYDEGCKTEFLKLDSA
ncbi:hypothetical protein CKA32_004725 [Geitlerinema sp. FC II]|nr:hypothetical protein CKA32_004725 [Geitlerinema sp. FC II]